MVKTSQTTSKKTQSEAFHIKNLVLTLSLKAQVGHIGSALSVADILAVLYFGVLQVRPRQPNWLLRDRFILSKGHAANALFCTLFRKGFFDRKTLNSYCQNNGMLGVHPEHHTAGVELSTGSLGHGLGVAVGMALAAKMDGRKYKTYVLISDAECNEGEIWQAALVAAHHKLNNLVVIIDYNKQQAFGATDEVLGLEPLNDKWQSFGWTVSETDGHNHEQLLKTFASQNHTKPHAVIARTIRGKGISFMEHKTEWHYNTVTKDQYNQARKELRHAK
ncbi:transketolase [Candidatus Microgenomates bacterium]|nr:MAG: transketolase [Candidatus Microgenomates bacterium]